MRNAFFESLLGIAERDEKVVFITGDLGYKLVDPFRQKFPERFINAGVAEQNMVGMAAGMALMGLKPWVYSIVPFVTSRCFEQIRNDIVFNNLDVKIVGVGGGYSYGINGPTHHSVEDVAILRTLPGMTIYSPGDPIETSEICRVLSKSPGPAYLRLGRAGEEIIHLNQINLENKKTIKIREGKEICLLATGSMLESAFQVCTKLKTRGIDVKLISLPLLKPFPVGEVLDEIQDAKLIVSFEEHGIHGGLGSIMSDMFSISSLNKKIIKFAIPDRLNKHVGDQKYLRQVSFLSVDQMYKEILNVFDGIN